jgi:hypothetical protein
VGGPALAQANPIDQIEADLSAQDFDRIEIDIVASRQIEVEAYGGNRRSISITTPRATFCELRHRARRSL